MVVPPGGYAVIQFTTNNPGWWHLHCHMAHHLASGMGMLLNEAPELQSRFPPPADFPKCGGLHDSAGLEQHVLATTKAWQLLQGAAG